MSKPIFYEGQQVGCLMLGEGLVKAVGVNIIHVTLNGRETCYYLNGAYFEDARHTLYPIEQYRAIIANLPAPEPEKWQPKPGEWCWFWENTWQKNAAVLAKFIEINGNAFKAQASNATWDYDNCAPFTGELPEHLKEEKP